MSQVVWTRLALANLTAIQLYLDQFNPAAARRVADGLVAAGNGLADFPDRNRTVPGTSMRELATCYPYVIRYRVDGKTVVILRIRHTSRRPTTP